MRRTWIFRAAAACVLMAVLVAVYALFKEGAAAPSAVKWQPVQGVGLGRVEVEMALYEKKGAPHFFLHFRVLNTTNRAIGADLRNGTGAFYCNQWGALDEPRRGMINESRVRFPALDDAKRAELIKAFEGGQLTEIAPGGTMDFYSRGGAVSEVAGQIRGYRYMFISLDGRLNLTDGAKVEQISCAWGEGGSPREMLEMMMPTPIVWKEIPGGGSLIGR